MWDIQLGKNIEWVLSAEQMGQEMTTIINVMEIFLGLHLLLGILGKKNTNDVTFRSVQYVGKIWKMLNQNGESADTRWGKC